MAKSIQLEHYQLTNTLSGQLVWCSRRSLSYYTPRKPAPSLPLATNLGLARENILSSYFLQYFQRSSNSNFCSLTASLSFITYDSETSTEEGNALVLSVLDIPIFFITWHKQFRGLMFQIMNLMRRFQKLFHYTLTQMVYPCST